MVQPSVCHLLVAGLLGMAGVGVHGALAIRASDDPQAAVPDERVRAVPDFPPGPPRMVPQGQKPAPDGGRVVLYSRSRYGNYPLATYAFHRGLRGDDASVANDVNLVFGNARRENAFPGPPVDGVPGVPGSGACGTDGGGDHKDTFRVNLVGGSEHHILDLGFADYASLGTAPKALQPDRHREGTAVVHVSHVYVIRLFDPDRPDLRPPRYIKLHVLRHRDNDKVLFEWAWLRPPADGGEGEKKEEPNAGGPAGRREK